ncbi:MAG: histidine phosphatase family protein [Actinomycetota bacterium]|nr:histidine phosphatase family protein [Actinomycetota bacterium]
MPVLLIRHAQAGARKDWPGEDRLRPLTGKGRRQAAGLVRALGVFAPQKILSSPYTRCLQTVAPLAAAFNLTVQPVEDLAEGNGLAALDLTRALADEKVALCSHGDVIPEILIGLADDDRVDLGKHPRQAKGSVWILESDQGHFHRATYVAPLEA